MAKSIPKATGRQDAKVDLEDASVYPKTTNGPADQHRYFNMPAITRSRNLLGEKPRCNLSDTPTFDHHKSFPLLQCPPEIRMMIFEMIVGDCEPEAVEEDSIVSTRSLKYRRFRSYPILEVSRMVYTEALPLVQARNFIIFEYDGNGDWMFRGQDMSYVELHRSNVQRIELLFNLNRIHNLDFVKELKAAIISVADMLHRIKKINELRFELKTTRLSQWLEGQMLEPMAKLRGVGRLIFKGDLSSAYGRYLKDMVEAKEGTPYRDFVRGDYERIDVSVA
ncbi:MAG: hypothetical protein M1812_007208 [Candelaria pacifica]|nr:MAG: hypothetical protein M1812_007208 [Candelaria pacifica]